MKILKSPTAWIIVIVGLYQLATFHDRRTRERKTRGSVVALSDCPVADLTLDKMTLRALVAALCHEPLPESTGVSNEAGANWGDGAVLAFFISDKRTLDGLQGHYAWRIELRPPFRGSAYGVRLGDRKSDVVVKLKSRGLKPEFNGTATSEGSVALYGVGQIGATVDVHFIVENGVVSRIESVDPQWRTKTTRYR